MPLYRHCCITHLLNAGKDRRCQPCYGGHKRNGLQRVKDCTTGRCEHSLHFLGQRVGLRCKVDEQPLTGSCRSYDRLRRRTCRQAT